MNILEFRSLFRKNLFSKFELNEIDFIYKNLLKSFFCFEPTVLGLNPKTKLNKIQQAKLNHALSLIKKDYPIQYITGTTTFHDIEILVNSNVLIPRPETEELVNWAIESIKDDYKIYDLCTGSGCIALALKNNNPSIILTGIDISKKAISIAKKNSQNLNLQVNWITQDIKKINTNKSSIDLIISNPPYVYPTERKNMHPRVLDYEPSIALFTPISDPIYYYRFCISFAKKSLRTGGKLFLEINPNYIDEIENLLMKSNFSNVILKRDFNGKKRMIRAEKYE